MKKKVKKITSAEKRRIIQMHGKGKSEREIAEAIGCARSTVWYWLHR